MDAENEPRRLFAKVFRARDERLIQCFALHLLADTYYRIGLGPRIRVSSCTNMLTSSVSMLLQV